MCRQAFDLLAIKNGVRLHEGNLICDLFAVGVCLCARALVGIDNGRAFSPSRTWAPSSAACRYVIQIGQTKPFIIAAPQSIRMFIPQGSDDSPLHVVCVPR